MGRLPSPGIDSVEFLLLPIEGESEGVFHLIIYHFIKLLSDTDIIFLLNLEG